MSRHSYCFQVLSERWGSAAEIARGLIDGASTAAGSGQAGSAKQPSSSQRPASDRHDGAASAHYLSGVRSQQTAMKRPTGLSTSNKLSWRRPSDSNRDREGDRGRGGERSKEEGRYTGRDRSRDRCSDRVGDGRAWQSRGSPAGARRDISPGDGQQLGCARKQGQFSRSAQDRQEGQGRRERDRSWDRGDEEQQHRRQQQQGYRGERATWRHQKQQTQQVGRRQDPF